MSRDINSQGTLNAYNVRADEVEEQDRYGYKVIAVIDEHFWTAFRGLTDWTDEDVAQRGDSISEALATELFPSLSYDRTYYR